MPYHGGSAILKICPEEMEPIPRVAAIEADWEALFRPLLHTRPLEAFDPGLLEFHSDYSGAALGTEEEGKQESKEDQGEEPTSEYLESDVFSLVSQVHALRWLSEAVASPYVKKLLHPEASNVEESSPSLTEIDAKSLWPDLPDGALPDQDKLINLFRVLLQRGTRKTLSGGLVDLEETLNQWYKAWHAYSVALSTTTLKTADTLKSVALRLQEPVSASAPSPSPVPETKDTDMEPAVEDQEPPPSSECQILMDMGFERSWCEVALRRRGNVEAAANFIFENMDSMPQIVEMDRREREAIRRSSESAALPPSAGVRSSPQSRLGNFALSNDGRSIQVSLPAELLQHFQSMGMSPEAALQELGVGGGGLRLLEELVGSGSAPGPQSNPKKVDANQLSKLLKAADPRGVDALRVLSGDARVTPSLLVTSSAEAPSSFPSIGARNILLRQGKWYYEVRLVTSGLLQLGWADSSYVGSSARGEGVGDDAHSWAFDGERVCRWHGNKSRWGKKWQKGDVVGCAVDIDNRVMSYCLNGKWEELGVAFRNFEAHLGLFPALSFSGGEVCQLNFGGPRRPFAFPPPEGYRPIHDAYEECPYLSPGLPISDIDDDIVPQRVVGVTAETLKYIPDRMEEETMDINLKDRFFQAPATLKGFTQDSWGGSMLFPASNRVQRAYFSFDKYHVGGSTRVNVLQQLHDATSQGIEGIHVLRRFFLQATDAVTTLLARKTITTVIARWPVDPDPPLSPVLRLSGEEVLEQLSWLEPSQVFQSNDLNPFQLAIEDLGLSNEVGETPDMHGVAQGTAGDLFQYEEKGEFETDGVELGAVSAELADLQMELQDEAQPKPAPLLLVELAESIALVEAGISVAQCRQIAGKTSTKQFLYPSNAFQLLEPSYRAMLFASYNQTQLAAIQSWSTNYSPQVTSSGRQEEGSFEVRSMSDEEPDSSRMSLDLDTCIGVFESELLQEVEDTILLASERVYDGVNWSTAFQGKPFHTPSHRDHTSLSSRCRQFPSHPYGDAGCDRSQCMV